MKAEIVKRSLIVRLHRGLSNSKEIVFGLHRMWGREKSKASPATSPMGRDNKHGWYEEHEKFVAIATRSLSSVLLVGDSMVKGLARYHRVWS